MPARAAPVRLETRDVLALEQDQTGIGGEIAGDQVEQGRLAGPVGPDDADRIAGSDAPNRCRRRP